MPFIMITIFVSFGFLLYLVPGKSGLITKLFFAAGLCAFGNLIFAVTLPDLAMTTLGG